MGPKKVILELTIHEAEILRMALQGHQPAQENEMISVMLYNRIKNKIAEAAENETL